MRQKTQRWGLLIAAVAVLVCASCGGGNVVTQGAPSLSPITLSLSPTTVTVATGTTMAFTATVNNSPTTSVSWQVNGITGGNLTYGMIDKNGNYTAPLYAPFPSTFSVVAFSTADNAANASATVTITGPPPPVTVTLTPSSASVLVGTSFVFNALVNDPSNTISPLTVTWNVNGIPGGNSTVGTIVPSGNGNGTYTAPAVLPGSNPVTISAVSAGDLLAMNTATVTVTVPPPPPVTISVSPASTSLLTGATQQFTATITGSSDTSATWQVNGITGGNTTVGTISTAGLYTAPAAVPSTNPVTITAIANADTTKSATATATILAPPPVTITVVPTVATIQVSTTQQFTATVTNTTNLGVTWQVNGVTGGNTTVGTISTAGFYTAPAAVPAPATVTVTAISSADTTKTATASVTITAAPQPVSIQISPTSATVLVNATQAFTATVSNTTNTGVTWQVQGITGGNSTYGTIVSTGNGTATYTAPATQPNPDIVTVTAVAVADTTKTSSSAVTISSGNPLVVTVTPGTAQVPVTATQDFTATVSGTTDQAVTWEVNGVVGGNNTYGTIDQASGLYTAPTTIPSPAVVTITAVSQDNTLYSGTATVTIVAAPVITVSLSPQNSTVLTGFGVQYSATVTGYLHDPTVGNWAVNGIVGGDINSVGSISVIDGNDAQYTAPAAVPNPATVTISASSNENPNAVGTTPLTIQLFVPITVNINPMSATLITGQSQQFTATVNGTSDQNVTWTLTGPAGGCTGAACGSLDSTGLYVAPLTIPSPPTALVTATAEADPTQSATATVTITQNATLGITISPNPPPAVTAGSGATITFSTTITNAPADTGITWTMGCISLDDSDSDWCNDSYPADVDGDGPGQFSFNGTTIKHNGTIQGPGNLSMIYTVPGTVGVTSFQANACQSTDVGVAQVPLTASVTYNGNQASAVACVTVNPPAK